MFHTTQQMPEEILHILLLHEDQDWLDQIVRSYHRMELRSYLRPTRVKHTQGTAGISVCCPISATPSHHPEICEAQTT